MQKLKNDFKNYILSYDKYFLKQGAFSLYHSKELDNFIKRAYEVVLATYFEDFLPIDEHVPFCILATKKYSYYKLCAKEKIDLLFIYKDIKAYNIKPMIKDLLFLLNDLGCVVECKIQEYSGLKEKSLDIISHRYICGSKILFKMIKNRFRELLNIHKEYFVKKAINYFKNYDDIPFIKQEFDIQNDFGGINDLINLENLLNILKIDAKNPALDFISEEEYSELKLAIDYILSLKSAINIHNKKDINIFLIQDLAHISALMRKKDKKKLKAEYSLLNKAMKSMHIIGVFARFLSYKIEQKYYKTNQSYEKYEIFVKINNKLYIKDEKSNIGLYDFLNALLALPDEKFVFDFSVIVYIKRIKITKLDLENALPIFKNIFYKKFSFAILKLFLDSGLLEYFIKPFANFRFLPDEENIYSLDTNAFLILQEYEKYNHNLKDILTKEEKLIIKLSIIMSANNDKSEISIANISRALCNKLGINHNIEYNLKFFKFFHLMHELIDKEDIYNENIIYSFISKLEDIKTLKILSELTIISAKAMNVQSDFYYRSINALLQNGLNAFEDKEFLDESTRRIKKEFTLKRSKCFLDLDKTMQDKILHIKSNLFIIKNSFEDIVNIALIAYEKDFNIWLDNDKNFILKLVVHKDKLNLYDILNKLSKLNLIFMSFFPLFDDKIYLRFEYFDIVNDEQKQIYKTLLTSKAQNTKQNNKIIIKKEELKLDLKYSKKYAKLHLNTKDQKGLMAYIMYIFDSLNIILSGAKIATIRQRTRNIFYIEKASIIDEDKLIKSLISK